MNTGLFWGLVIYAGIVAGCATGPSVDTLTGEQRAKLATIKIFHSETSRRYEVIESVSVLCCQRGIQDSRIDAEEEAYETLKIKALLLGADAVVNTGCQKTELGKLSTCWSLEECSGDAVKFIDK